VAGAIEVKCDRRLRSLRSIVVLTFVGGSA
jgi:hypothetical protein